MTPLEADSSPFKNGFRRSSRGNEAHFSQEIRNDSRAS